MLYDSGPHETAPYMRQLVPAGAGRGYRSPYRCMLDATVSTHAALQARRSFLCDGTLSSSTHGGDQNPRAKKALQLFMPPVSLTVCMPSPDSHSHQMKTPCRGYIVATALPPAYAARRHRLHLRL
jgi:hypothetical protein